jgi:hypothetical protein
MRTCQPSSLPGHDLRLEYWPGCCVPRPYGRIMASWFAGLRSLAGARAAGELPADAVVSLRMADGGEASFRCRG